MNFTYQKAFQNDPVLLKSYFAFTQTIFDFDLAKWKSAGHWNDNYIPHSLIYNNRVIANISASIMKVQINGAELSAVQFGSVGVLPEYRGKGLARLLMEKVLEEYRRFPLLFLFAGEDVWDFYAKFCFKRVEEILPYINVSKAAQRIEPQKVTPDSPCVKRLLNAKLQHSSILDARGNQSIYWFHLLYGFPDNIYYIPEKDLVFLAKYHDNTVDIYDILSEKTVAFAEIKVYILKEETTQIRFYFTPDWLGFEYAEDLPYRNDNILHVLGDFPEDSARVYFKFPKTGQT